MPPIRFSDSELDTLLDLARPLPVAQRDAFIRLVAAELAACGEIGPGAVYRVAAWAQRQLLDPRALDHGRGVARSRRR
jgi:hypothetical protein